MQAGDRLGEYVLVERLGEGGFGEVWKAELIDLPGAPVAIKVPTKPDCAAALRREGALQNVVDHPNVVRALSVNTANDPPYLVSEYVDGESLRRRIDREKRLTARDAAALLVDVLDALEAAHRAGVVHRDVKPENVLLTREGMAKLSDFGLGRITESVAASIALSRGRSLTEGGGIVGTFAYMSPEQMKGLPIDLRTDLYSCGVLLYEMLTGEAHPIRLPVEGVSKSISDVVDRALRTDPERRFQSATQMSSALQAAVRVVHSPTVGSAREDTPIREPQGWAGVPSPVLPATPTPPRPWTRSLPKAAAPGCIGVAGVVFLLLMGFAFLSMRQRREEAFRAEAQSRMEVELKASQREALERTMANRSSSDPAPTPIGPYRADPDSRLLGTEPSDPDEPVIGPPLIFLPELQHAEAGLAVQDYAEAEGDFTRLIARLGAGADCDDSLRPTLAAAHYGLARAYAMLSAGWTSGGQQVRIGEGRAEQYRERAFTSLRRAHELGYRALHGLEKETDLKPLWADDRWNDMVNTMRR